MPPIAHPPQLRPCLPALAAALCLSACDAPGLFTIFTALAYTGDGQALLLEATDGIYLASPPDSTPQRLGSARYGCEGAGQYALGCARMAADGRRIALLRDMKAGGASSAPLWDLWLFERGNGNADGIRVAAGVADAAFTPDSGELLWTRPGQGGRADLFRLGPGGEERRVIEDIELGAEDGVADALDALIVTSAGVAYARGSFSGRSLWFQPFDDRRAPRELGGLAEACAGSGMANCHDLSHDGVTFAWQEAGSSILQIYRSDADLRLPLGSGSSFRFSRAGALLLRFANRTAFVHRADSAAVVREVSGASAAQLSADGESLAYLAVVSSGMQTSRLMFGPARQSGADSDGGILAAPEVSPLWASVAGSSALPFSFTGDGRFVIAAAAAEPAGDGSASAALLAIDVNTGEARVLDELACSRCCQVAAAGALVLCTPIDAESAGLRVGLDIYDPATGKRTRGADALLAYRVGRSGTAVALTDFSGDVPELKVASLSGQVISLGTAYQFALSPTESQIAYVNRYGKLSVANLP